MTEVMLNHLVQGLQEAGAEVEVVNLREKNIKNCIGCYSCWTKTPGQCIHKDDMSGELFPKWLASDLVVYATPLYFHTMNAAMSTFKERTLPAAYPFFELGQDGKTFHPLRDKIPDMVWLSVCGFPEAAEFDLLSEYVNRTRHKDVTLVAEIYRSAAEMMTNPVLQDKKKEVLEATIQAGRELVQGGRILSETMAKIRQPLIDSRIFAQIGNSYWKTCIAEGVTPKEFQAKKMVPRPDSLESFMLLFPFGIQSEAAEDRKVVLQFIFSGSGEKPCYFVIEKGKIEAEKGTWESPDLTIETTFDLWLDIMTGKADGQQMFMEQKYKVTGDLSLMIRLFQKKNGE
jgi:multimeric flavodoxin WrbA